jgi:general secretion pathway protein I
MSGFSLLELVVALAIMALALGVLYRAIGGGVRAVGDASKYEKAVLIAESLLEMRDSVVPGGWQESGAWESFHWSISSSPYDAAGGSPVPLHRVQADVAWRDGAREHSFSLVSVRPQLVEGAPIR